MSLFDLQDVCIAIGSIATLDLPMVVDLIVIYGLKGPYCTLTTTDWFLQALSVIPRGSWGDVARRSTMIRWAGLKERLNNQRNKYHINTQQLEVHSSQEKLNNRRYKARKTTPRLEEGFTRRFDGYRPSANTRSRKQHLT
ncbi:triacylglycerol lipase 2 [Dorcoceras hygrometricum]|uniref:Triacylglycerol lipase 2 n=1 Tax=Dorcoceras hygrometricum TaxID=472368 RepID=A0A2Z7BTY0_9LAMI|nr:triacylglycerol lipase 2 [Dorcoceras hygrometricum]